MLASIRIKTAWTYQHSVKPNRMRSLPAGWVGQLDVEVAAAAIADGVAEARGPMSPELSARVVYYSRVLELHRGGLSLDQAIATADVELLDDETEPAPTEMVVNAAADASAPDVGAPVDRADAGDVAATADPKPAVAPRRRKSAA